SGGQAGQDVEAGVGQRRARRGLGGGGRGRRRRASGGRGGGGGRRGRRGRGGGGQHDDRAVHERVDLAHVGERPRLGERVRRALALLQDPRVEAAVLGAGGVAGGPAVAPRDGVTDVDRGRRRGEVKIGDGDGGVARRVRGDAAGEARRGARPPRPARPARRMPPRWHRAGGFGGESLHRQRRLVVRRRGVMRRAPVARGDRQDR